MIIKKWSILLILFFLSACLAPINKNMDGGFLSQKPCGPPCFHGVTPQITTQAELLDSINKSESIFYGCKYMDLSSSGGVKGITCDYIDIRIKFTNNIVENVRFIPSDKITSQTVINKYGSPDSVHVYTFKSEHSPNEVDLYFCYDKLFTSIAFEKQSGKKYSIDPNTIVYVIFYEDKDSYKDICGDRGKNFYQWDGYGDYPSFPP